MMQQRTLAKPIIRRRLLDPVDPAERLAVLQLEWTSIVNPARRNISRGMTNALLLQLDYLGRSRASLLPDVRLFLKTRGRTARIEVGPFGQPKVDLLPAILLGPDSVVGVILGCVHIDDELFLWVFFPRTGGALVRTLAEERAEHSLPRDRDPEYKAKFQAKVREIEEAEERLRKTYAEKGISVPLPEKSAEERLREYQRGREAYENRTKITRDRKSALKESIQDGIHLIRCSHIASWEGLYISEMKINDN